MINVYKKAVDFVFPLLCPGCYTIVYSFGFCPTCWKNLDFITPPYCLLCGDPFSVPVFSLCYKCRLWLPLFTSHRSLWRYGPVSKKVIFALKHGRQRYLAPLLAKWLLPMVLPLSVNYIMPVPLHPKRLAYRGFNQSALIAVALEKYTKTPVMLNNLKRVTKTSSQGGLSLQQRQINVDGAFECNKLFFNEESVLLIDDVYTTGATLSACVAALRDAGAGQVHCLTLAKVVLG